MAAEPNAPRHDARGRRRKSPGRRLARTILLAAALLAACLYGLQSYLAIEAEELLGYAGVSLLWVGLAVLAAATTAAVFLGLRSAIRLLARSADERR